MASIFKQLQLILIFIDHCWNVKRTFHWWNIQPPFYHYDHRSNPKWYCTNRVNRGKLCYVSKEHSVILNANKLQKCVSKNTSLAFKWAESTRDIPCRTWHSLLQRTPWLLYHYGIDQWIWIENGWCIFLLWKFFIHCLGLGEKNIFMHTLSLQPKFQMVGKTLAAN